jgi:hypothetical protein
MKKLMLLTAALTLSFAAPVFACPGSDSAAPKTAKKDTSESKDTATKDATAKKPATTAKKADDKVSMK